jgi:4-amino-4-deoxy-L-arabinose transferase-like glycosyltransferase
VLRLVVAGSLPLSPDEAYYWVWSRALAAGYPDHPAMVALWIRAGTWLAGPGALGVRLLAPLAAAAGSLLLADAGRALFPGRGVGVRAAVLLNATLLLAVGAVTQTPDTPLLLFWTATLWSLARLLEGSDGRWWLAAGLAAGLAADSKYTAFLLAPAALIWVLGVPSLRHWLRRWELWGGAALAIAAFAPVLAWNARHSWVSLLRQGGRAADWRPARALQFLGELVGGQVGLATPLLAVLFAVGAWAAVRHARRDPAWAMLAAFALPPAAVFVVHALGDRVQANWPCVCYPALALAAAAVPGWRRWRVSAAALGFALTLAVYVQAGPLGVALPRRFDPLLMRLGGWPALARAVGERVAAVGARAVVVENYGLAAELARLLPADLPVVGLDPRWADFSLPRAAPGGPLLLLRSARLAPPAGADLVSTGRLARGSRGVSAEAYALYLMPRLPPDAVAAELPRPR